MQVTMKNHRFFFFFFLYTIILKQSIAQHENPVIIGSFKSVKTIDNGIQIIADNAVLRIIHYSPSIIRIRVEREGFPDDFSYAVIQKPSGKFTSVKETKDSIVLKTDSLSVIITKNPVRVKFLSNTGKIISEDYPGFGVSWLGTEVSCYKKLFPDERFIGLGEKTGPLDRRGQKYENWNSDIPSYTPITDPLYVTIPFYMGIHDQLVYGIFLDNSYRTRFNFGASTDNQFSSFSAEAGELNYYFFGASTIAGIIRDYTWLTGRMKLPPYWSLGFQQCRWGYYPESEVMSIAQSFRDKKLPCDVLYLDIDYMDAYKIFTWNKERFPQPKTMIDKLEGMGFHLVTIVDPGIKIEPGYKLYDEGVKNDFFIKYPDGKNYTGEVWPGRCHFPDFTKESTRTWWGASFSALTDPGVEGFWNDMNEPSTWGQDIPGIVQLDFDGHKTTIEEAHNVYGLNMARATYEGTRNLLNGKRPFVLTRAGYAGVQRYSAVWTGDNFASDEHLMLGVRMVNSLGLSGLAFTGPDIGGFMGNPTRELYTRWLSVGVYTPFMRNHAVVNSQHREPWSFGEETERIAREIMNQRYQLLPYLYSSFYESTISGMPVSRSLAINYTFDEKIYEGNYQQEYLFGDNILVSPVTSEQKSGKVWFPEGGWYRLSSGQYYRGNSEGIVESPLDDLPVFVKASGIIPMQSVIQNTDQKPASVLIIHVYNGTIKNSFTYYEDDGITYESEKGKYYKRTITFDPLARTVKLLKREGTFSSKFTSVLLDLHDFRDVTSVKVNGKDYPLNKKSELEKEITFPFIDDTIEITY
jgi:alpha-glucosidase